MHSQPAERDETRAALDRVRALHVRTEGLLEQASSPNGWCLADGRNWPCPTIRAIDGQDA